MSEETNAYTNYPAQSHNSNDRNADFLCATTILQITIISKLMEFDCCFSVAVGRLFNLQNLSATETNKTLDINILPSSTT